MLKPECDILKGLCLEKIGEYKPCGSCYIGKGAVEVLAEKVMSNSRRSENINTNYSAGDIAEAGEGNYRAGNYEWTVRVQSGIIKYNSRISNHPIYPADLCE